MLLPHHSGAHSLQNHAASFCRLVGTSVAHGGKVVGHALHAAVALGCTISHCGAKRAGALQGDLAWASHRPGGKPWTQVLLKATSPAALLPADCTASPRLASSSRSAGDTSPKNLEETERGGRPSKAATPPLPAVRKWPDMERAGPSSAPSDWQPELPANAYPPEGKLVAARGEGRGSVAAAVGRQGGGRAGGRSRRYKGASPAVGAHYCDLDALAKHFASALTRFQARSSLEAQTPCDSVFHAAAGALTNACYALVATRTRRGQAWPYVPFNVLRAARRPMAARLADRLHASKRFLFDAYKLMTHWLDSGSGHGRIRGA